MHLSKQSSLFTVAVHPAPYAMQTEPTAIELTEPVELGGVYNLPGEGFVVELHHGNGTYLFDKRGLQHRIMEKKRLGLDAAVEEAALLRINSFAPFEVW